jgi:hypothetical protein
MCSFAIAYSGSAEELVAKARSMIEDAGGAFSGDTERGNYTVKLPLGEVRGEYRVEPGGLAFQITKKPMMVPCAAIETFLRSKLGAK